MAEIAASPSFPTFDPHVSRVTEGMNAADNRMIIPTDDLQWLGIPQYLNRLKDGFHPFTPDRTVILKSDEVLRKPKHAGLVPKITQELKSCPGEYDVKRNTDDLVHIIEAAGILTEFYGVPGRLFDWSQLYAVMMLHFYNFWGFNHLFIQQINWQPCGSDCVKTQNEGLDWWLFLIPDGLQKCGYDDQRTHILITPIYMEPGLHSLTLHSNPALPMMEVVGWTGQSGTQNEENLKISRMDETSACHLMNQRVRGNLQTKRDRIDGLFRGPLETREKP